MKKVILFVMAAIVSVTINAQTIFSEDFEGVTVTNNVGSVPEGWTTYADNLVNTTQLPALSQSWDIYDFGSSGKMAISISWTEPEGSMCDRWLVTPAIPISDSGMYLNFQAIGYTDGTYAEKMEVKISTTNNSKESFTTSLLNLPAVPAGLSDYLVDLSAYVGQTVYISFINKGDGYYLILDNISILRPIQNEIEMSSVNTPAYARVGADFDVKGVVVNKGAAALTSFDVTYSVDGGDNVATYTVSGINVPYNGTYTFTHNVPANIAAEGAHEILVTVSNPNGVEDDATNNAASKTITIYENGTQRTVLFEQFTTGKCPNCPPAHEYLAEMLNGKDNVIWMSHHAGYYTDSLTIPENEEMLVFYNDGGGTYAPTAMIDRTHFPETGEPGPVMSAYVEEAFLDNQISVPSFVTVEITDVTFNSQTRELSATVSGTVVSDISAYNSPRVSLYVKEDNIKMNQSGAGTNYIHNNSMRDAISNVWGDENVITSTTTGSTFSKTYTYTVPTTMKAQDLYLVAFVTEYNNNVNARSVLNATQAKLSEVAPFDPNSINTAVADVALSMYPNPATDYVMVSSNYVINEIAVINALGQTVATYSGNAENVQINTQDLAKGVYMISIKTAEGSAVKKLTVVK